MRKNIFLYLKLLLLFLIFFWIFKTVNIKETLNVLSKTILIYFFIAFIINNISSLFLTIKWYRLATPLKINSNFLELLKLNYISMFYGIFFPGQATGELVKGYKLTKKEESFQKVWVPIFIDKITNLLITFLIGFVAVLSDKALNKNSYLILIFSILTISFSLITIILFSENTNKLVSVLRNNLMKIFKLLKLETKLINLFSLTYFEEYKKHNLLMFETLIWSLLVKLPHIFAFYCLALSLNLNLSLIQSAWLFSIVSVASLLPISFSGLGVREGTVLILFSQVGIDPSNALSYSMLIFTSGIMIGLIGGLIELISSFNLKTKS